MKPKKDSPILNKIEKINFENWLRHGIVEEINVLNALTKEDYNRAFKLGATKQKSSSLIKYL
jgi:hypothetical protein